MAKAAAYFDRAIDEGLPDAAQNLALVIRKDANAEVPGLGEDLRSTLANRAAVVLVAAVNNGSPHAAASLLELKQHLDTRGIRIDAVRDVATEQVLELAARADAESAYRLAMSLMEQSERDAAADSARIRLLLQQAVKAGHVDAARALARILFESGKPDDLQVAAAALLLSVLRPQSPKVAGDMLEIASWMGAGWTEKRHWAALAGEAAMSINVTPERLRENYRAVYRELKLAEASATRISYSAAGKPVSIVTQGHQIRLGYDGRGRLATLTLLPLKAARIDVAITRNRVGRTSRVTIAGGAHLSATYGSDGYIETLVAPDSRMTLALGSRPDAGSDAVAKLAINGEPYELKLLGIARDPIFDVSGMPTETALSLLKAASALRAELSTISGLDLSKVGVALNPDAERMLDALTRALRLALDTPEKKTNKETETEVRLRMSNEISGRMKAAVLLAFVLTIVGASPAAAGIDVTNLNYTQSWIDFQTDNGFRIERAYNSRTLYDGAFGFGWCSDFESRLKALRSGFVLATCGAGAEIKIERRPLSNGGTAFQSTDGAWTLSRSGAQHRLSNEAAGTTLVFDYDGYLLGFRSDADLAYSIVRSGNRISTITVQGGEQFAFQYSTKGKIVGIAGRSQRLSYEYDDHGNLTKATNMWGNSYYYEYNRWRNLIKASYPDGTAIELSYDDERDWVKEFCDRSGCVETYAVDYNPLDKESHYWISLVKTCRQQVTNRSRFEFAYLMNTRREKVVWRNRITVNGEFIDREFDLDTGQIARVELRKRGDAMHDPLR